MIQMSVYLNKMDNWWIYELATLKNNHHVNLSMRLHSEWICIHVTPWLKKIVVLNIRIYLFIHREYEFYPSQGDG